ncbi:uncharacterized protein [Miscanthus floridulus]|uniref:uncharacterized protein n=1 Tax=Miscanthus floridulus TaxID=154761 RepID=UPI00345ADCCA
MLSIGDARGMYTGQLVYCGRRATLSIGDARGMILEGATIYDASARASGDYAIIISRNPDSNASAGASEDYAIVVSRNPDNDASAGAFGDYAIVVSRNLDSDATARASRDYAIIPSHNPDNGVWVGNASRQRRSTADDGAVDDIRRPPAPLLLWQQRLLSKGSTHHLIYIG